MEGAQVYFHVRVLVGVVLALGITRILSALPRFVQQARTKPLDATHLLWIGTVLLMSIHFWWFEFGLIHVRVWRFELFVFVLFYAFLFYLIATLLVPDSFARRGSYHEFFMARRRWFFGLLAATIPVDIIDTLAKGNAYFQSLGTEYLVRLALLFILCLVGAWTSNRRFHLTFAALYFVYFISYVVRLYNVLE